MNSKQEKLLFLGPSNSPLHAWLRARGEDVVQTEDPVDPGIIGELGATFIISYGYKHLLRKDVLDQFPGKAVNLHISLLPWNRGADPNYWSFVEGTPKGVTIHFLDEGVDTGDIIVQQEVAFDMERDTLASTYAKLHAALQELFKSNWDRIRDGTCDRLPQRGRGSFHRDSDHRPVQLTNGWETPIAAFAQSGRSDTPAASTSPWAGDDASNIATYTDLLSRHGRDHRSLDWGSRESQHLRFRILSEVGPISGGSLLDIGCGIGDLPAWLDSEGIRTDYLGIDFTASMVSMAASLHPARRFLNADLFDLPLKPEGAEFDFVFASGIFAKRQVEPERYFEEAVARMFALCRTAVAFNVLSSWAGDRSGGEFHADPLQALKYCRTLTPWVALRHDYHPRDFTVYLYRSPKR